MSVEKLLKFPHKRGQTLQVKESNKGLVPHRIDVKTHGIPQRGHLKANQRPGRATTQTRHSRQNISLANESLFKPSLDIKAGLTTTSTDYQTTPNQTDSVGDSVDD